MRETIYMHKSSASKFVMTRSERPADFRRQSPAAGVAGNDFSLAGFASADFA